jgi:hypothetical protein
MYSIDFGWWWFLDGCCESCATGIVVTSGFANHPRGGAPFIPENWELVDRGIMHLVGWHVSRRSTNVDSRHGDIQTCDICIFWQVVEELASFILGTHASEPKPAQSAFEVVAIHTVIKKRVSE